MKEGSLVVILPKAKEGIAEILKPHIEWFPKCDGETVYVIRILEPSRSGGKIIVCLEEGIIGHWIIGDRRHEIAICADDVREVQPPMSSEEIEEMIKEEELVLV